MFTVIYWGGQILFFPGWGGCVPPPMHLCYMTNHVDTCSRNGHHLDEHLILNLWP